MNKIKLNIQRFASTTIMLSLKTVSGSVTFQGKLECSSTAGSSSDNYSSVTVNLYARKQNASQATYGKHWTGNIVIDGTTSTFDTNSTVYITNSWVLLHTYSKTVYHNSDGTKSITISGSVKGPSGTSLASVTSSGSGTFTLDTIPRYFSATPSIWLTDRTETQLVYGWSTSETCSAITFTGGGTPYITGVGGTSGTIVVNGLTPGAVYTHYGTFARSDSGLTTNSNSLTYGTYAYPSITSTPNFTIGQTLTIGVSSPRGLSCVVYLIGANGAQESGNTTTGYDITGYINSYYQDFFYNSLPNSASGTYKVRLVCSALGRDTTINGGTYTIDYNVSKPTFSNFIYQDVNSTTLALTNDNTKIINGYSTLQVSIPSNMKATGYSGATISKYNINGTDYNYSDNFTQNVSNYSLNYVNVSAKDSRGNEKVVSKNVTLVNYFKLTNNGFSYSRNNDGIGTQVTFNIEGTFWNDSFGQQSNTLTTSYKYKKTNESTYHTGETAITLTTSGNNFSFSGVLKGDGSDNGFSINDSYNVVITVADKLSEINFNFLVIEGSPAIDLFGNCISLGGYYNETTGGRVQINGINMNDSGWIYPQLNSGWSNQYANASVRYRKIGNVVYLQMFVSGTAAASNVIFNLPSEYRPSYQYLRFPAYSDGSTANIIEILESGNVSHYNKNGGVTWLSCNISFLTD